MIGMRSERTVKVKELLRLGTPVKDIRLQTGVSQSYISQVRSMMTSAGDFKRTTLEKAAIKRNTNKYELRARILTIIERDDLWDAILDDQGKET